MLNASKSVSYSACASVFLLSPLFLLLLFCILQFLFLFLLFHTFLFVKMPFIPIFYYWLHTLTQDHNIIYQTIHCHICTVLAFAFDYVGNEIASVALVVVACYNSQIKASFKCRHRKVFPFTYMQLCLCFFSFRFFFFVVVDFVVDTVGVFYFLPFVRFLNVLIKFFFC